MEMFYIFLDQYLVTTRHMDWASQMALLVKSLPANAGDIKRHGLNPWVGRTPWRREW